MVSVVPARCDTNVENPGKQEDWGAGGETEIIFDLPKELP